ncbi:hypothetical protein EMIHUDRAFT_215586 [Emiliania huxleyi CCMP1516]|uniref:HIT-type domain-containing protein n=2 Tax=Emiliania huxleyi TaxID=2903 RepID=A0A0D3IGM1_EMIH1|nr:hypothetical protein EMIHUDRAFT_215586 [Emiliania huxleyi CCMP1516]EOD10406.1 hypothetical protein EMIHUDRAFT_215586 [Emiliania huxleyi CCMP1516]|eukprot:XP_005762835.1 hypothetical protein EMIHUDRAFT_215586 [Emiliania huxleyi CCMP1516]
MTACHACSSEAKYRCPGCGTQSCSLACVKKHKEATQCSGKRDVTAFRAIGEFDDASVVSDYHFLEAGLRSLLPAGMQRARENSSSYDARRKLLRWRVELRFGRAGITHVEAAVGDRTSLRALLEALRSYSREGVGALRVLLPLQQRPANDPRFVLLPLDASLGESLRSHVVTCAVDGCTEGSTNPRLNT